jgi:hypothetical protein
VRAYRTLLRLYPRTFRHAFADDLVTMLEDLVTNKGRLHAWRICALDLLVTVPRMHLERAMNPSHTTTTITFGIALLAAAGAASILTGLYPGALLLAAAVALGVAQRSALARAIRVPDTAVRHRRLRTAAVLAVSFVACYVVFLLTIGDEWTGRETILAVVGTASMIGAGGYLIAGLATPRDTALRT